MHLPTLPTLVSALADRSKRPSWQLFFVLIAFILGVAVHSFIDHPLSVDYLLISGGIAFCFFLLSALPPLRPLRPLTPLKPFCLLTLFFLLGLLRYSLSFPVTGPTSIASYVGGEVRVTGTIASDPDVGAYDQTVILDHLSVNTTAVENKINVSFARYPELAYGTTVSFRCTPKVPEAFEGFAYDRYLLRFGVVATCSTRDEPMITEHNGGNPIQRGLYRLRHAMIAAIGRALPEPHASLAAGLLLGVKMLPQYLDDAFRAIGTSHIVAASGYNVSMVLTILLGTFAYFMKRQRAFWFLVVGVICYVLLAGAEAAVVRAGIMGLAVLIAAHSGRQTTARNLLAIAAVIMLVVNPRLLRDDVGFQLSMLATIGLVVCSSKFSDWFHFLPKAFTIRESLASTLAATLFTLPIILLNFGQFSFISPIANLLILPLVPYAMAFAFTAMLAAFVSSTLAVWIGGFAWALLELIILIAKSLAAI